MPKIIRIQSGVDVTESDKRMAIGISLVLGRFTVIMKNATGTIMADNIKIPVSRMQMICQAGSCLVPLLN